MPVRLGIPQDRLVLTQAVLTMRDAAAFVKHPAIASPLSFGPRLFESGGEARKDSKTFLRSYSTGHLKMNFNLAGIHSGTYLHADNTFSSRDTLNRITS